jgi:hypothetical protein
VRALTAGCVVAAVLVAACGQQPAWKLTKVSGTASFDTRRAAHAGDEIPIGVSLNMGADGDALAELSDGTTVRLQGAGTFRSFPFTSQEGGLAGMVVLNGSGTFHVASDAAFEVLAGPAVLFTVSTPADFSVQSGHDVGVHVTTGTVTIRSTESADGPFTVGAGHDALVRMPRGR